MYLLLLLIVPSLKISAVVHAGSGINGFIDSHPLKFLKNINQTITPCDVNDAPKYHNNYGLASVYTDTLDKLKTKGI